MYIVHIITWMSTGEH